jgi:hypothetical protein
MGRSEAHEPREDRNVASWARQVVSCQRPTTPNRKEVQPRGPRPDRARPRAGGGLIGHHLEPVPEAVTQFSASTPAVVAVDPGGTLMVRTHPTATLSGRKAGMWTRRACSRPAAATASPSPIEVRGAEPGQALAVHIDWTALDAFHLSEAIRSVTA